MKYILAIIAGLVLTGAAFTVPSMAQTQTAGTSGANPAVNLGPCNLIGPDGNVDVFGHVTFNGATELKCVGTTGVSQSHEDVWHSKYSAIGCNSAVFGAASSWTATTIETGLVHLDCKK